MSSLSRLPRLVVFSDDWGRHPSSCQHLIEKLLDRYHVDWVNTIGTRRPKLSLHDFKRAMEKLKAWARAGKKAEQQAKTVLPRNLEVHSPIHWPGFKTGLERKLNLCLFLRSLKTLFDPDDPPVAVITTASIPADLAEIRPDLNWVYYCVDDLSEWPGLDGDTLREMELVLLKNVKRIVCVSEHLQERLAGLGHDSSLLTHGIDLEHWQLEGRDEHPERSADPVALYWGHADRRLDTKICLAIAATMKLRMVGPRTEVDPALLACDAIEWTGSVPYSRLPHEAARANVLVMPYADLPVTRAMQPLKLKEYLATGLPVVATGLPANEAWSDAMDLTWDAEEFARLVRTRAAEGELPPEQARARERLEDESWVAKSRAFERDFSRSEPGSGERTT